MFYLSKNTEKKLAAKLFLTLIIIGNVSRTANQDIRMISERSCDTEDWSNDRYGIVLIKLYINTRTQNIYM